MGHKASGKTLHEGLSHQNNQKCGTNLKNKATIIEVRPGTKQPESATAKPWNQIGRIGEAKNPGPGTGTKKTFVIESANITSLETHINDIAPRKTDIMLVQEHSTTIEQQVRLNSELRKHKKQAVYTNLDPDCKHNTGGVATITSTARAIGVLKPKTKEMKEVEDTGRAAITAVSASKSTQIAFANVYGYSGGNSRPKQLRRTNLLLQGVSEELKQVAGKSKIILGDLNADIEKLEPIQQLIQDGWVD